MKARLATSGRARATDACLAHIPITASPAGPLARAATPLHRRVERGWARRQSLKRPAKTPANTSQDKHRSVNRGTAVSR